MLNHTAMLNDLKHMREAKASRAEGIAKAISAFCSFLSNWAFRNKMENRLKELAPEIARLRKSHYGVLIEVVFDVHYHIEIGAETPIFHFMAIVGGGKSPQDALNSYSGSWKPTSCPVKPTPFCKAYTRHIWYTPFGMEVY